MARPLTSFIHGRGPCAQRCGAGPGFDQPRYPLGLFRRHGNSLPAPGGISRISTTPAAPPQAIVNEEFVRRYLDHTEPIGRRITARGRSYVIAGVVRNSVLRLVSASVRLRSSIAPIANPSPRRRGEIHVRTRVGAETVLASDLRRIVRELDPTMDIYDVRTMNEHVEKNAFLLRRISRADVCRCSVPCCWALADHRHFTPWWPVRWRSDTTEIAVRLRSGRNGPRRVVGQIVARKPCVWFAPVRWQAGSVAVVVDMHVAHGVIYLPVFVGVPGDLCFWSRPVACLAAGLSSRQDRSDGRAPAGVDGFRTSPPLR